MSGQRKATEYRAGRLSRGRVCPFLHKILQVALLLLTILPFWGCAASSGETEPTSPVTPEPAVVVIDATAAEASPGGSDSMEDVSLADETALPDQADQSTPAPVISSTTGRTLPGDQAYRPVLVVIGNAPQTRPQTGLLQADIIYELPLERNGNQTRFLCVYSDTLPASAGPVQSARAYFLTVEREWSGMLVYEGYPTNPDYPAFDETNVPIPAENHQGIHQYFYQDKTVSDEPEDTLFVRLPGLTDALFGVTQNKPQQRFLFQKGVSYSFGKKIEKVGVTFAGSDKNKIEFVYEPKDNRLYRYEKNSKDALVASKTRTPNEDGSAFTTEQVSVQNLIVQHVVYGNLAGEYRDVTLTGMGKCDYFVNGQHFTGVWKRESLNDPTSYLLNDNTPLILEPGTTWIALQPTTKDIRIRYAAMDE